MKFLAGGAASGLPVKIRARMQKREGASFPDFDGVLFANGGIRMGRFRRSDRISEDDRAEKKFPDQRINLDTGGSGRVSVSGLPVWDHASRFELEGEYRDPNGEIQTVHRSSNIYPSRVLLGIQPAGWAAHAEKVQFKVAAVSPDGKAVAGQPMKVSWIQKQTFSHRKRIVGGFYA